MLRRMLSAFVVLLLPVAAGWLAYQTSTANATPAEVSLTVTASEFKYDPPTIRVRVGQIVHLTFRNASTAMVHELRLKPFIETKAGPGLENTQTFVASVAGTYKFTCKIPGHEDMVGELIVH
jgi:plastocyanin